MTSRRFMSHVQGPNGDAISLVDLPDPGTRRWGLLMKARVVAGVEGGLITLVDACVRYDMSLDEYLAWKRRVVSRNYPHLGWIQTAQPRTAVRQLCRPRAVFEERRQYLEQLPALEVGE